MHIFVTVFTVVALLIQGALVFLLVGYCRKAFEAVDFAIREGRKAVALVARVDLLEQQVTVLQRGQKRIDGKLYSLKAEAAEQHDEAAVAHVRAQQQLPMADECVNWKQAQLEGPHSPAAQCECAYCLTMRQRREEFRRAAVPRTATGQAKIARVNAGLNDGE